MILNSGDGISDNATGIIEYCTFINDGTVTTALHIERGNGIIVRHNLFEGITQGIRIAGAYTSNNLIEHNEFVNCSRGIGVGYTYPAVGAATGTIIKNNTFTNITQYHIWTDKATVTVSGNIHNGKPGSVNQYNYGGGSFINAK